MRSFIAMVAVVLSSGAQAQKIEVKFGTIEGPHCVSRTIDRVNAIKAPVQRAHYARRVTRLDAVVVAGSGTDRDNAIVSACAEQVRAEIDGAKSSAHLSLFHDVFEQQVRRCISKRDQALQVYEVYFRTKESCLSGAEGMQQ
jgi:spore coat polysaccharide biosynthesis protein SpsF (cytidylyltransferase family)